MIKIGSHVSFKKPNYLIGAIEESIQNGANSTMIYLGPPQSSFRVKPSEYKFKEYLENYKNIIKSEDIIVHAPYIINLANSDKKEFSTNFLIEEINRANYIGIKYLVLHPGAYTKYNKETALKTLIESLNFVISKTENVIICLETMAGKGTEICTNFEDILFVINSINSKRIAICLDTCHIWDAGYNIKKYEQFKKELIDKKIIDKIKVIHLNDSLNDLDSHKDRHANIDKGFIGLKTLKKFVHDKDFDNIPIILETPYIEGVSPYKDEIKLLLNK